MALGAVAALTVVAGAATAAESPWTTVEKPTGNALFDVEETTASVYAVGGGARVYDRDAERWSADATPTGENLKAVVVLGGRRRRRDRAQTLGTPPCVPTKGNYPRTVWYRCSE
jgi:hypothetical protein